MLDFICLDRSTLLIFVHSSLTVHVTFESVTQKRKPRIVQSVHTEYFSSLHLLAPSLMTRIYWIWSKLLGLWLRSSLIILNPCETVRSQRKTMFTRVKRSAEEEINRSVYASAGRSRTEKGNKRKNVYVARRSKKP